MICLYDHLRSVAQSYKGIKQRNFSVIFETQKYPIIIIFPAYNRNAVMVILYLLIHAAVHRRHTVCSYNTQIQIVSRPIY